MPPEILFSGQSPSHLYKQCFQYLLEKNIPELDGYQGKHKAFPQKFQLKYYLYSCN